MGALFDISKNKNLKNTEIKLYYYKNRFWVVKYKSYSEIISGHVPNGDCAHFGHRDEVFVVGREAQLQNLVGVAAAHVRHHAPVVVPHLHQLKINILNLINRSRATSTGAL